MASFVILEVQDTSVHCAITLDDGTVVNQYVRGDARFTMAGITDAANTLAASWPQAPVAKRVVEQAVMDAVQTQKPIELAMAVAVGPILKTP